MQYTLLGNTGLTVSRLAFGAMTFTAGNKAIGAVYKVGADLAGELVGCALDAGINFFDTADAYAGGESETMLGAALKPHRDQIVIATKVGFRTGAALPRAGLSRRHGQMYYSLVGRDVERDVVPMMQRYGLGLTVWSPLASGFLSGKYTRETLQDPGNRLSGFDILPIDKEAGFKLVERMRAMAGARAASVAQIAIAWLLARQSVTSVLIGATKLGQLEDNLKAAAVSLTAVEIAELDAATALTPVYPNFFTDNIAPDRPLAAALASPARRDNT